MNRSMHIRGLIVCAVFGMALTCAANPGWSVYHRIAALEPAPERAGPAANDVTMRTLEFREVPPGSQMDVFQALRDFHANRLEWTYIDFDERNRAAIQRVRDMGVLFGGAGSASLHGSIRHIRPQPKDVHMLDLDGNMIIQPHMRAWVERRGIGDPSNPDFYEHHLDYWKKVIDWGAQALHRDEPESPVFAADRYGGGFSPSGVAGFRAWLQEHVTEEALADLGIRDVEDFDYGDHLRALDAPVGDALRHFDCPIRPYWVQYWSDTTTAFWQRMIADIKSYAGDPDFTISCNNSSLQMWAPYHRAFGFAISELLIETANPVHLWERARLGRDVGRLQVFGPPKTRAQPVPAEAKNSLLRKVYATAFATGMLGKLPWDVFDQSPDGEARYFAEASVMADLTALVRAGDWANYAEAVAVGVGLPDATGTSPQVSGGTGGVYVFVRAPRDEERPVLIHLVDWGLPIDPPGPGNYFITPHGERIRMYTPEENIRRTDPAPFDIFLPRAAFDATEGLSFTLLTPKPYDASAHVDVGGKGDFASLVQRDTLTPRWDEEGVVLSMPTLSPWGIVEVGR